MPPAKIVSYHGGIAAKLLGGVVDGLTKKIDWDLRAGPQECHGNQGHGPMECHLASVSNSLWLSVSRNHISNNITVSLTLMQLPKHNKLYPNKIRNSKTYRWLMLMILVIPIHPQPPFFKLISLLKLPILELPIWTCSHDLDMVLRACLLIRWRR